MKESEIDGIFRQEVRHEVDPELLSRISSSMARSMRPVRPIAPVWMLASLLLLISATISIACAGSIGMYGIRKLSGAELGAIFPALAIFTWLAALLSISQMTPGGFHWRMTNAGTLLLGIVAGWVALDAALFHDYALGAFVPQGVRCLRAGLVVAIPAGVASWIVLRRGFAVNPSSAGLAAGTLAGLAGLTMLELHCPILLAPHVMVWHTSVVPLSALAGALLARIATRPT
jgi:hypothetical protein